MMHVEKFKGEPKFEVQRPTSTMDVRGAVFEDFVEEDEASVP